ncbi:MAG: hypothetical protein AAGU16_09070 [Desulfitobacterium hafniense]
MQKSRPPPTISGERTTLAIGLYVDCLDSVIIRFRMSIIDEEYLLNIHRS